MAHDAAHRGDFPFGGIAFELQHVLDGELGRISLGSGNGSDDDLGGVVNAALFQFAGNVVFLPFAAPIAEKPVGGIAFGRPSGGEVQHGFRCGFVVDKGEGLDGKGTLLGSERRVLGASFKISDGGGRPETPSELGELVGPFVGSAGLHGCFDGGPDFGFLIGRTEADRFDRVLVGDVDLWCELGKDVLGLGCGEVTEGQRNIAEDGGVAVIGHRFSEGDDVDSGAADGAVCGELHIRVGVIQ
jgi:hypothetical protein